MKENKCILWTKACNEKGYGLTWKYGKIYKAHRDAYEFVITFRDIFGEPHVISMTISNFELLQLDDIT